MYITDYKKIIIFDTETTGLNFDKDNIIEFAYTGYKPTGYNRYLEIARDDIFINVDKDITKIITDRLGSDGNRLSIAELTHITPEMLKSGIKEVELAKKIKELFFEEGTLVIGYNLNFDLNMVSSLLKRYNLYDNDEFNTPDYLDLYTVYKDNFKWCTIEDASGKQLRHRLDAAVYNLGVTTKNTHRAIDDVLATFEVFKKLIDNGYKIIPFINNFGFNPKYLSELKMLPKVKYYSQTQPKSCWYGILSKKYLVFEGV